VPCVALVEEDAATFRILQFDGGVEGSSPAEDFPDFRDVTLRLLMSYI